MWPLFLLLQLPAFSQTISGTVNSYAKVTAFDICSNRITVSTTTGFAIGDTVLIIQMKGAVIDQTNSVAYGSVSNYNHCGNFEKAIIQDISGLNIAFQKNLLNAYDVAGSVQMVRIPQYNNVTISGVLTCPPWNGNTGGVLIIEASGTVTMSANITVDTYGFRGGSNVEITPNSCSWASPNNAYFYAESDWRAGRKGEGIAAMVTNQERGKGRMGNGGGGGNDHNAGGGGGSNGTAGGQGGTNNEPGTFNCKGLNNSPGGLNLDYSVSRLFFGGGGGAGHGNNAQSTSGANGGGIVIINANTLLGNGFTISAKGGNALNSSFDGAGGGGGGGAVFLNVSNFGGSNLTVNTSGGNGGSANNAGQPRCYGPGGGGSGGVLVMSLASLPGTLTYTTTGGNSGLTVSSVSGNMCNNTANGATAGTAGTSFFSRTLATGTVDPDPGCGVFPVEWAGLRAWQADDRVRIEWETLSEDGNLKFSVERSGNGQDFYSLVTVPSQSQSGQGRKYGSWDDTPLAGLNFYRIRQEDVNGAFSYSPVAEVHFLSPDSWIQGLYPNPVGQGKVLNLELNPDISLPAYWTLADMSGRFVQEGTAQNSKTEIATESLLPGIYFLKLRLNDRALVRKVVITE